jgi:hypothetical protein
VPREPASVTSGARRAERRHLRVSGGLSPRRTSGDGARAAPAHARHGATLRAPAVPNRIAIHGPCRLALVAGQAMACDDNVVQ